MLKLISMMFLFMMLCGCNNSSSSKTTTSQVVETTQIQSNQNPENNTTTQPSYGKIETEQECGDCAPPNYLEVPSYQYHKLLNISLNAKNHLSAFLLKNFNSNIVEIKEIIEPSESNNNLAQGTIVFNDGYLAYTLPSSNEIYKNSLIRYTSNNSTQPFTDFENEMLYKIIDISGEENPQKFLQELISSKKNHDYKGCYIQQKTSRLGILELVVCDSDNKKFLTLYNPK